MLILALLVICCVSLGKSLILSGLGFVISSVRGPSGSSSHDVLRSFNFEGWLEIPSSEQIYVCREILWKEVVLETGQNWGKRLGKAVKFSGNKSSLCN